MAGLEQVRAIVERVAVSCGLELVEVELRGSGGTRFLRITIDKPGGVTHGDCEAVSREAGTIIDVEDAVPGGAYTLEVTSPGLDRKLRGVGDFERFAGKLVKVQTREPIGGTRHFEGRLEGVRDGLVVMELSAGKKQAVTRMEFELAAIDKANLVPEI